MLSSLSGGGIAYKLELEIIRSPSTSWASQSSSPSSTLSENSNSPVAISTRKARTPRKRPNQTYNEAAALLSTAYPKIFSATVRNPPGKFTRPNQSFSGSSSDLLLPFSALDGGCDGFLLQSPVERILNRHPAAPRKLLAGCGSPTEIDSNSRLRFEDCDEFEEDFESESILDEEIEEGGIDSIMGKISESNDSAREAEWMSACYGFPIGMGFKAIKQAENGDWWRFPVASINVADITPKSEKSPPPATEKKKKKKKVEKPAEFRVNDKECSSSSAQSPSKEESSNPKAKSAGSIVPLVWKIKRILNVGSEKKLREVVGEVREFARKMIREKKGEMGEKISIDSLDLLSRFLNSGHSDEEFITDIVISFILAGRDTTSAALSWFFWLIFKHPRVEEEIVREITAGAKCETPVYDEVKEMVYTHACLCETMRLYPPVPVDTKAAIQDDILPDGTPVKKGTRVSYHPYAMGRVEKVWGADWRLFRPERWLDRDPVTGKYTFVWKDPFTYPVFQAGPRVCLGKEMAFLQMKRVVAGVLRRFTVVPATGEAFEPVYTADLTSKMMGGFPVRIVERPASDDTTY